jgi:23S rRNA pseudouridine2605 synthase
VGRVTLNRALSKLGILSRAQATDAIRAGRVRVDDRVITNPAHLVIPERVRIRVDGKARTRAVWRTIIFHKPRGIVTTRSDPEGRATVYDALGDVAEESPALRPVGRLDLASTGLLILTTDTRLANWLTDPANDIARVYLVAVRGLVTADKAASLPAARVIVRKSSNRESHLTVELRQGRNREIRRMFNAIDHEVTRLKRVRFGGLELGSLESGRWREISARELQAAFPGAPISDHGD